MATPSDKPSHKPPHKPLGEPSSKLSDEPPVKMLDALRWSGAEGAFIDQNGLAVPMDRLNRRIASTGLKYDEGRFVDRTGIEVPWAAAIARIEKGEAR